MHPLSVCLVTFNCARTLIDPSYFAAHLLGEHDDVASLPDLIVLSLQEIAPIAQSFLGGGLLTPYFTRFKEAIEHKAAKSSRQYRHLCARHVGLTAILIFARHDILPKVQWMEYAGVGVGHWEMGNKGAVGIRLAIAANDGDDPALVTFVAAHLAAMEDAFARRNEDWRNIVRGLVFVPLKRPGNANAETRADGVETEPLLGNNDTKPGDTATGMFRDHCPVFIAGDLNYRTNDVGPSQDEHEQFPKPSEYLHRNETSPQDTGAFERLKQGDQLTRERKAGNTLHQLDELPINFPPTYKYSDKAHNEWPSDDSEPKKWLWAKHRFPSWCDRVLFSSGLVSETSSSPFRPVSYEALPLQPTSDHRPVVLRFSLDLHDVATNSDVLRDQKQVFPINANAAAQRAYARRMEILVGSLAYLALTWEGNAMLLASVVGTIGGWIIISSVVL